MPKIQATLFVFILCFAAAELKAQIGSSSPIEIMNARSLKTGRSRNHQKLVGSVMLKQGNTIMKCDSAEINQSNNDFMAWGHVFLHKNNSIKAWGDSLHFNGQSDQGKLMGNCKMKDKKSELKTKIIYIDQRQNIFYYLTPTVINMDDAVITSNRGYYYTSSEKVSFKSEVRIVHPDYKIFADSLDYFASTRKTVFHGPTNIHFKEEIVYCEDGFYDDKKKLAEFKRNATVVKKENTLRADIIQVDKQKEISKAFNNVILIDTVNKINISGHKGYFNRKTNFSYVTDQALFVQFMKDDTLFMHGDTLRAYEDKKKHKSFYVYYNVRLYKKDMQAICDSLSYNFVDSLIRFYYEPIIWNGSSQLTGDTVSLLTYDNELKKLYVNKNSFVTSLTDSTYHFYDQIKGKNMIGHFKNGKMDVMDVFGNGQTLYYAKEDDKSYSGVNKAECSNLRIKFGNNQIQKIVFLKEPKATFYPLEKFPSDKSVLDGFIWHQGKRPLNRFDLFRTNK